MIPPAIQQRQILQQNDVAIDSSLDQQKLLEFGLVIEQQGRLTIANLIYRSILDLKWVDQELLKLRPYAQALIAWRNSRGQDYHQLLAGTALQQALNWAQDKNLSQLERQFLAVSQIWHKPEVQAAKAVQSELMQAASKLWKQGKSVDHIITATLVWTQGQRELTHIILKHMLETPTNALQPEADWVKQIVHSQILERWHVNDAAGHLSRIQDGLLKNKTCQPLALLEMYQQILQSGMAIDESSKEQQELLKLALVAAPAQFLKVANPIYQAIFDQDWLEQAKQDLSLPVETTSDSRLFPALVIPEWECINTFSVDTERLACLALSPDSQTIASLGYNSRRSGGINVTAKLWDAATGKYRQEYTLYQTYSVIGFNAEGDLLASGEGEEGKILLWDSCTKKPRDLPGHKQRGIAHLTFVPASKATDQRLLSISHKGDVKLWDLKTGKLQSNSLSRYHQVLSNIRTIAISPDSKIFAWVNSNCEILARYLNTDTSRCLNQLSHKKIFNILPTVTSSNYPISTITIIPDGKFVISGDSQRGIKL